MEVSKIILKFVHHKTFKHHNEMKFYYSTKEKETKFGFKVTMSIYKIVKGVPKFLCHYEYNTSSCKGENSEIFKGLVINGFLPKKYLHSYAEEIPHTAYKL